MYVFVKRFFDILLALIILIILLPLLIPIMIGLRMTGEGYVWYFQKRLGYKNKEFNIWKFATMLKNSPNMKGGIMTTKKDPRITPMGGFLRKSKINEIPQIINVLLGHMSFVGPRPLMQLSFDQYSDEVKAKIYRVKPGITGVGSIVFREEEKLLSNIKKEGKDPWEFYKSSIVPYKGALEIWYQKRQGFLLDFSLLILTGIAIFMPTEKVLFTLYPSLPKRKF